MKFNLRVFTYRNKALIADRQSADSYKLPNVLKGVFPYRRP